MVGLKGMSYTMLLSMLLGLTSCAHLSPSSCSGSCTDDDITTSVQVKLEADRCMSNQFIIVDTYERVVTLNGHVANPTQRKIAIDMAKSVPGVKYVKSNLTIVPIRY